MFMNKSILQMKALRMIWISYSRALKEKIDTKPNENYISRNLWGY